MRGELRSGSRLFARVPSPSREIGRDPRHDAADGDQRRLLPGSHARDACGHRGGCFCGLPRSDPGATGRSAGKTGAVPEMQKAKLDGSSLASQPCMVARLVQSGCDRPARCRATAFRPFLPGPGFSAMLFLHASLTPDVAEPRPRSKTSHAQKTCSWSNFFLSFKRKLRFEAAEQGTFRTLTKIREMLAQRMALASFLHVGNSSRILFSRLSVHSAEKSTKTASPRDGRAVLRS